LQDVKVWNVIEELINTTIQPLPSNPFKIDYTKLLSLPTTEKTLNTISLVNFLRKVAVKQTSYKTEGKEHPLKKYLIEKSIGGYSKAVIFTHSLFEWTRYK
jgi:hypothetical protein